MPTTTEIIAARLRNAEAIVAGAAKTGVPLPVACALIEKESGGHNVYGHDRTGVFSTALGPVTIDGTTYPKGSNIPVTAKNYAAFYEQVVGQGKVSNGVGPSQITYRGFLTDAKAKGVDLADPAQNIAYGLGILAGYLRTKTVAEAGTLYNAGNLLGGITVYGHDLAEKARAWKTRLDAATTPPVPEPSPAPETPPTPPKETPTMTFSPLTYRTYSMIEKNYGSRKGKVNRLIIHHTTGGTLAYLLDLFRRSKAHGRSASVTYILDREGRLHGLVPEEYRPWTSGSASADSTAVTVETMTFQGDGYKATPAQLETLARLAADLSNRYGWGALNRKNVRGHREFASTSCPGPYIWPRMDQIVSRANAIRSGGSTPKPPAPKPTPTPGVGLVEITADTLNVRAGAGTQHRITTTVKKGQVYTITEKSGSWGRLKSGAGWIHLGYTKAVASAPTPPAPAPANLVRITAHVLNVRSGPGTGYKVTTTVRKGQVYTITETKNGWGRLKSGAGWIHLGYTAKA